MAVLGAFFYIVLRVFGNPVTTQPFKIPVLVSPNPEAAAPMLLEDSNSNWKTYTDTKVGFSFKYPPEATVIPKITENSGHYVSVKSTSIDLTVSIDSLGYDPGNVRADKTWEVIVNGITWNARYDKSNKCTAPCPAATMYKGIIGQHEVGYLFIGESPSDEFVKNYISTFYFTN